MVKQSAPEAVAPVAAPATTYTGTTGTAAPVSHTPMKFERYTKWIRIAQLLCGLIVLGLLAALAAALRNTCAVADYYYGYCVATVAVPSIVSYNIFNGVWTFLVCCYLIPAAFKPTLYQPIAVLVLDALTAIFWFSGFIALAVLTGVYADYTGDNYSGGFGILIAAVIFALIALYVESDCWQEFLILTIC